MTASLLQPPALPVLVLRTRLFSNSFTEDLGGGVLGKERTSFP